MADARPNAGETRKQTEYQKIVALMKEIGSRSGFDPVPPDQHRWMMDADVPPLQRMWGWMIAHTVHWGHRNAFAINQQNDELHIEHAAKDLGMDVPNAYHTWKKGVQRGIWRNGEPSEGPRRMYLTGKVPKFKSEESVEKSVQTILSTHILKQIKDWPKERVQALRDSLEAELQLEKDVQAALVAANRAVFVHRTDSILSQHGLEPAHQKHVKKTEKPEDAEARLKRIEPIRAPIEEYVQTIKQFVQSAPKAPVQTTASLLHSESKNQRSNSSGRSDSAHSRSREDHSEGKKPAYNQLPALQTTPLNAKEKHAEQLIFSEIRNLQIAFKHMDWSHEIISPKRKSDVLFAHRVIATVGPDYVDQFLVRVGRQLKNLDRNAFGKLPGSAPAPRSLGLILHWAEQYAESMDEAARVAAADQERWQAREIAACQEIVEDPTETAEAKYEARKRLEKYQREPAA